MAIVDYYNTNRDSWVSISSTQLYCQTFTASKDYTIIKIRVYIARSSDPGNVTFSIRAIDGTGKPTGTDLSSAVRTGMELTTGGQWEEFVLTFNSSNGTKYSIVALCASAYQRLSWACDVSSSTYSGGSYGYSLDGGITWTMSTVGDMYFETYEEDASSSSHSSSSHSSSSHSSQPSSSHSSSSHSSSSHSSSSHSSSSHSSSHSSSSHSSSHSSSSHSSSSQSSSTSPLEPATVLSFPAERAVDYDPDLIFDDVTGTWVTDEELLAGNGSRYRSQFVCVGMDLIYYEEFS